MPFNFKSIMNKQDDDDYTEFVMGEEETTKQVPVVVDKIESFACGDRIVKHLREGKIVFAKIGQVKHVNVDEFRRTVSKIKNICVALEGDMVGVGEEWVIIAPSVAKIERGS
ncbi:MAG: cell division protein SepF [Candidatus Aenigmatarchaeota archaeon]